MTASPQIDFSAVTTSDFDALAFDFAPVGIVLTEDRFIRACNRTFAALFGYERNELIGESFRMLYASVADFEEVCNVGFDELKAGRCYSDERVMPRRDGSRFWCRCRAYTFFPQDPLRRAILTFADLSDRRPDVSLTARERQVVQLLTRGLTSKEIGRNLEISPRTVDEYRSQLLAKFEVHNVAGLLARVGGMSG